MNNNSDKPIRLLNRNFILLWQGQFVSLIGDNAFFIGMMFWLTSSTGSATLVGLILMLQFIPAVVLSPVSGVLSDRFSRRKIIVFSDLIRGILILCFVAVFVISDNTNLTVIILFVVCTLMSVAGAFFRPAVSASIPRLVPPDKLIKANSMNLFSRRITGTIGLSIGGLLFRVLGAPLLFFIDGISYIFSGISELFIKIPQDLPEKKSDAKSKISGYARDIKDGLGFIFGSRGLTYMIFSFSILNFLITPLMVLLPFFVTNYLNATADWYGYLAGGYSLGSIIGYSLAGTIKISGSRRTYLLILSNLLSSALLVVYALIINKELSVTVMTLWGVIDGFRNVLVITILQQTTPDWIRGRVFSVYIALSTGLQPVGMGLTGFFADIFNQNIPLIFIACGILSIAASVAVSISRQFRKYLAYKTPGEN